MFNVELYRLKQSKFLKIIFCVVCFFSLFFCYIVNQDNNNYGLKYSLTTIFLYGIVLYFINFFIVSYYVISDFDYKIYKNFISVGISRNDFFKNKLFFAYCINIIFNTIFYLLFFLLSQIFNKSLFELNSVTLIQLLYMLVYTILFTTLSVFFGFIKLNSRDSFLSPSIFFIVNFFMCSSLVSPKANLITTIVKLSPVYIITNYASTNHIKTTNVFLEILVGILISFFLTLVSIKYFSNYDI